jgi:hypothetical protein
MRYITVLTSDVSGEPPLATSGIRFNDYFFSEPVSLAAWRPPKCAGLLSILIDDPNWAPRGFQPIYFGEFGNNTPAPAMLQAHTLVAASARGEALFVSILPMLFSTTQQRLALRRELILAYHPVCQTDVDAQAGDLELKLAELEKKHQEQTAQMIQLMANAGTQLEAPPVRRRRIGFVA